MSLVLTLAASIATHCAPIPGSISLFTDRTIGWIVVGELHGTAETPAAFADLVCAAGASRRPVVVGVEYPPEMQAPLDTFLASDGGEAARTALLDQPFWRGFRDGRSSKAFATLLDRLRTMKTAGAIARVIAFQPGSQPGGRPPAQYEQAMAAKVSTGRVSSEDLMIALVGNLHARMTPRAAGGYLPMAGLLPKAATRTIDAQANGGSIWACITSGPHKSLTCGPLDLVRRPEAHPRGIVLEASPDGAYSGTLYLGVDSTASPPAVPDPPAEP